MSEMTTQEMIGCLEKGGLFIVSIHRHEADAIAARLKALDEAIRNAPHGMGCHSLQAEFQHTAGWASLEYCDCWKRAILDAAREVE